MLGGVDPVIIFQFSKLSESVSLSDIPVVSDIPTLVEQPPVPIYLSENLTGLYIESEDKNVDIQTDTETLSNGESPNINQKGISSIISINLIAKKDSVGMTLLSAMIDQVYEKVTSKEYAITYLHGATTVFRGVLHSFAVNQNSSNDLLSVKIELSKGMKNPQPAAPVPVVPAIQGPTPL